MAHPEFWPMVVFVCRSSDGMTIERRRVYHAYVFDMEIMLYECFELEQPGVYLVFFRYYERFAGYYY